MGLSSRQGVVPQGQLGKRESFISHPAMISGKLSKYFPSSSSRNISAPLGMKFHDVWLDPDCPVWQWYQLQSQAHSSTKFTSIQHCRNTRGPLFHEYLLIQLDNGDVCRIERMGEGSRNDAVKPVGCLAQDIVQWLPASDYWDTPESQEPHEIICQVSFPCSFDVVDVLAICYSIQRHETCSRYTLQRYNCYFLCLNILAVLVRRVGKWEEVLATDIAWSTIVDQSISSLQEKPSRRLDQFQYAGLEICDLLQLNIRDPITKLASRNNNLLDFNVGNPRDFVLEPIRSRLPSKAPSSWLASVSRALWMDDLNVEALSPSHYTCVVGAVEAILSRDEPRAKRLAFALDFNHRGTDTPALLDLGLPPKFTKDIDRTFQIYAKKYLHMRLHLLPYGGLQRSKRDSRVPLKLNVWSWICAFGIYFTIFMRRRKEVANSKLDPPLTNILSKMRNICESEPRPTFTTCRYLYLAEKESQKRTPPRTPYGFKGVWDTIKAMASIQASCQSMLDYVSNTDNEKIAVFMITMTRDTWIACLDIGLAYEMAQCAMSRIGSKQNLRMTTTSGELSQISADEFHNLIRARIHSHAVRVGSTQLATSQLVELDICEAMTEVWRRLPCGYGGLFNS
ncbi:unnamed protein product [Rhizoctonia solani]|uniref:Uncharacterized protein n=1 Tax=Rhizoctonia solani TaxID=456999 RepID=A0A8H2WKJ9_9AGAM|nr:unnamed protein product [Rhizoctonia solani]